MIKKNFDYIDVIRGLFMLHVVYGHVLFFGYNGTGSFMDATYISSLFSCISMPMFFFISGFLSYSPSLNSEHIKKSLNNRISKQLWPTIILLIAYSLFCEFIYDGQITLATLKNFIADDMKGGYWFTISMVEVYFSFAIVSFLFYKFKLNSKWYLLALLFIILFRFGFYVFAKTSIFQHQLKDLNHQLCFYRSLYYAPFFYMGVVWRIYSKKIKELLPANHKWVLIASFFYVAVITIIIHLRLSHVESLWAFVAIPLVFACFYTFRDSLNEQNKYCRMLMYIGKNTLSIYLVHYFILTSMIKIGIMEALLPLGRIPIVSIAVALLLTFVITCLTCLLDNVVKRYIPFLHDAVFSPRNLVVRRA